MMSPERNMSEKPPCPEGARLGEANLHNRGCGSRRETYLRTEAPTHAAARRAVLHDQK